MAMEPGRSAQPRVVVIDDDPDFIRIITDTLRRASYRVDAHDHGTGARQFVREARPDLVILDIHLGDRSGWDVFQALRLDPDTEDIPVLVCSGDVEEIRRFSPTLLRRNADVLGKPFDLQSLLLKVHQLTSESADAM
jgi:DNA-binding response OmpR family regulator